MHRGEIVLVDTNVVIEAIRTHCWSVLCGHYRIETVEKCVEEARTGDAYRPGYVAVEDKDLERLTRHRVSERELATLVLREPRAESLDAGERHLWAHALTRQDAWFATTADAAAVRVAVHLGWRDRLVSLEQLACDCGGKTAARQLNKHFRSGALSEWRTQAMLDGSL